MVSKVLRYYDRDGGGKFASKANPDKGADTVSAERFQLTESPSFS